MHQMRHHPKPVEVATRGPAPWNLLSFCRACRDAVDEAGEVGPWPCDNSGRRTMKKGKPQRQQPLSFEEHMDNLDQLTYILFSIQDLNKNGVLEEEELIALNESIARLHNGDDFDTSEIREVYRDLFRTKLDPHGRPVPYETFRDYIRGTADPDPEAQEMVLEHHIVVAKSGVEYLETMHHEAQRHSSIQGPALSLFPNETGAGRVLGQCKRSCNSDTSTLDLDDAEGYGMLHPSPMSQELIWDSNQEWRRPQSPLGTDKLDGLDVMAAL
mmetsp:Transcript_24732/g.53786  ORF Transcript_24732/g.53786 Transcript_24732/m.53786 type:complete len:270 (-) Transcript_24732:441-1250(-)